MAERAGYEQAPGEGFDVYQGKSGAGITQDRLLEELGQDGFENFAEKLGKNIFDSNDPNNGMGTLGAFMNFGFGLNMINGALDIFNAEGPLGSGNFMSQGNTPGFAGDFLSGFANKVIDAMRSFSADGAEITQPQAGPSTPGFNPNQNLAMNTTNNPTFSPSGPGTGMA